MAIIDAQRATYGVTRRCRRYRVTPAGFYAWQRRGVSAHTEQDRRLQQDIARLFMVHHERYGSPRLYQLLRQSGWRVSRRRVARLMRGAGCAPKRCAGIAPKWARSSGMRGIPIGGGAHP